MTRRRAWSSMTAVEAEPVPQNLKLYGGLMAEVTVESFKLAAGRLPSKRQRSNCTNRRAGGGARNAAVEVLGIQKCFFSPACFKTAFAV